MSTRPGRTERWPWQGGLLFLGVVALVALPVWGLGRLVPAPDDPPPPPRTALTRSYGVIFTAPKTESRTEPVFTQRTFVSMAKSTAQTFTRPLIQPVTATKAVRPTEPIPKVEPDRRKIDDLEGQARDYEQRIQKLERELEEARRAKAEPAPAADHTEVVTVTLARTTYALPAEKASALAKTLTKQVKGVYLEARADGDRLVVTTTPEAQKTVAAFVGLVRGKATRPMPAPVPQ